MKITLGILNTIKGENPVREEVLESIQDNLDYFDQIIFTGNESFFEDSEIEAECLNLDTDNKAVMRNAILENAKNEYIFWMSDTTVLEFDMIPEMMENFENYEDVDIVYPNMSIVDNSGLETPVILQDLYNKETDLLMSLKIEKYFPEYGIITKKDLFNKTGKFDEEFEDYEFYNFLYQNIDNIRLKLAEFNYVVIHHSESFIDTSFRSYGLRKAIKKYPLSKFFPKLNWENENLALATAYTSIGDVLSDYLDYYNASQHYRQAALSFHNKVSLFKLVNTYYKMGLFDEAKKLSTQDQGFSEDEIKNLIYQIDKTQELITAIEKAIEEGKLQEVIASINDVASFYSGAPIYNILGIIEFYSGNKENAYKYFYKAATMNPLDENIIHNLTDMANMLGKQEKVKGLFKRLLGEV
ncbi:glycosyltransferase family 2 protein [Sulfurihydrogenibium subterraneum]|uniref:glycosyltransferase family 2 protein n=1 Tax=Sulfurihydrogenibium subterraneum TaxID=171121 RepID=UPI00048F1C30|nr:glycosyltransferase family 2 protein [Sulfurihydrogenibium subterraneum]